MKKYIILLAFHCSFNIFAQGLNKPSIVIVPDNDYMNSKGFVQAYEENGSIKQLPDYQKALLNSETKAVLDKMSQMFLERGFQPMDIESELQGMETEEAEDMVTMSKDGDGLAENPLDILERRLKADIWIYLTWTINQVGPQRSISFTMKGVDSYTKKQIAIETGTGGLSMISETTMLLQEAVIAHIEPFTAQMQRSFDDVIANGRIITLTIKRWGSADYDLESEYDGEYLMDLIEEWVSDNSVNGRYTLKSSTSDKMVFVDVRIGLFGDNGKAQDAQKWVRGLTKYLKDNYEITAKRQMKGLGAVQLVLGAL